MYCSHTFWINNIYKNQQHTLYIWCLLVREPFPLWQKEMGYDFVDIFAIDIAQQIKFFLCLATFPARLSTEENTLVTIEMQGLVKVHRVLLPNWGIRSCRQLRHNSFSFYELHRAPSVWSWLRVNSGHMQCGLHASAASWHLLTLKQAQVGLSLHLELSCVVVYTNLTVQSLS